MTRLVCIVVHRSSHFLLEHSCDSDNPTSAGSTFHSLKVLGKKENLGVFLELKGIWNSYVWLFQVLVSLENCNRDL